MERTGAGKSVGLRSHRSRVQSSPGAPFIVALSKSQIHINNICTKASKTLGFLRRNLFSCPHDVKEAAYKGLVRPVLEYGSSVWDPHTKCLQEELEKVQNRAARFVTRNYSHISGADQTEKVGAFTAERTVKDVRLELIELGKMGAFRKSGCSHIKLVCMCRPRLKRRGLTELIKLKRWVLSEMKEQLKLYL